MEVAWPVWSRTANHVTYQVNVWSATMDTEQFQVVAWWTVLQIVLTMVVFLWLGFVLNAILGSNSTLSPINVLNAMCRIVILVVVLMFVQVVLILSSWNSRLIMLLELWLLLASVLLELLLSLRIMLLFVVAMVISPGLLLILLWLLVVVNPIVVLTAVLCALEQELTQHAQDAETMVTFQQVTVRLVFIFAQVRSEDANIVHHTISVRNVLMQTRLYQHLVILVWHAV